MVLLLVFRDTTKTGTNKADTSMAKSTNKLTELQIKHAKPKEKRYPLTDGEGMFLLVMPNGGKYWRMHYRFNGEQLTYTMGVYPDVSLTEARERRWIARQLLKKGIDPNTDKKIQKAAKLARDTNSFEHVAREWFAKHSPRWAASHADKIITRFEKDVFPWLGGRPIAEITPPEVLVIVQRIEARGALDTAHRALQNCSQVFRYAVATCRVTSDPCRDLKGALPPVTGGHFAAIIAPDKAAVMLRQLDEYRGEFTTRCALRLAPLVFVRPGELRQAQWKDIDLEAAEWRYFVSKTKTDHVVALSRQAVAILLEIHPLTGNGRYVFAGQRTAERPMSEGTVLAALRRMGITKEEMSGHGFRAMARTMLQERLKFPFEYIEHQLAHKVPDALGTAYNRTKFLDDRKVMMQAWADYLDKLKAGAEVVQLNPKVA